MQSIPQRSLEELSKNPMRWSLVTGRQVHIDWENSAVIDQLFAIISETIQDKCERPANRKSHVTYQTVTFPIIWP